MVSRFFCILAFSLMLGLWHCFLAFLTSFWLHFDSIWTPSWSPWRAWDLQVGLLKRPCGPAERPLAALAPLIAPLGGAIGSQHPLWRPRTSFWIYFVSILDWFGSYIGAIWFIFGDLCGCIFPSSLNYNFSLKSMSTARRGDKSQIYTYASLQIPRFVLRACSVAWLPGFSFPLPEVHEHKKTKKTYTTNSCKIVLNICKIKYEIQNKKTVTN